ncbi:hypothetical protein [Devosia geojensis]|nr:hypothetical protein [Devosia geojensis]
MQLVEAGTPYANPRFGQRLADCQFLACCWQVENCQYVVKTFRIRL